MNIYFGGAFNPVTKAHKEIVLSLLKINNVENIIISPMDINYKKDQLIENSHRFNMLELSFHKIENVVITDVEFEKDFVGTKYILDELSDNYNDLALCIGADNLESFSTWVDVNKLLDSYKVIVFNRKDIDVNEIINNNFSDYKNQFIIHSDFISDYSSTMFRENFDINVIESEVLDYINKNNIYKR